MELQLGLALPANTDRLPHWLHSNYKKRGSEDAFRDHDEEEGDRIPRTLTLFHWDNQQPEEEEEEEDHSSVNTAFSSNKVEGLIGWPPIKTHRRKLVNYNQYHRDYNGATRGNHAPGPLPALTNSKKCSYNSKYLKVKMEGVGIARKIDLTLYPSLATLKRALFAMFDICQENFGCYELTYQDSEGDWRLAEEDDVTWRNFVGLAQRLELVKSNNG